ncbi:MAG: TetR/AcrR family transcriptional regulator [Desulfomonilia bacterium]
MPPIPELEAIRKAQILDAALRTIADYGCSNVTMDDICRAAGLSKGGLNHYFKSKNDLFMAVFQEFFKQIFQRGEDTMNTFTDPMDKLLSFSWLYGEDDPDLHVGYPILFDFMSVAVHEPEYRKFFQEWIDNWLTLLKKAIILGKDQGMFAGVDPDSAAMIISAIYQGIATRWYLAPETHSTKWALDSLERSVRGLLSSYSHT